MTMSAAVVEACDAIRKIDGLLVEIARTRAERDAAVIRALDEGVRPSVIRRATGLSISMIRVIRDNAAHARV